MPSSSYRCVFAFLPPVVFLDVFLSALERIDDRRRDSAVGLIDLLPGRHEGVELYAVEFFGVMPHRFVSAGLHVVYYRHDRVDHDRAEIVAEPVEEPVKLLRG
jgi:hypothetical protein